MPCLFRPFFLGKIFSSNFPCKGKDLICFGFLAGAQKYLPLVLDELAQLVMADVLVHCAFFLPSRLVWLFLRVLEWCSASSSVDLWAWGGG